MNLKQGHTLLDLRVVEHLQQLLEDVCMPIRAVLALQITCALALSSGLLASGHQSQPGRVLSGQNQQGRGLFLVISWKRNRRKKNYVGWGSFARSEEHTYELQSLMRI